MAKAKRSSSTSPPEPRNARPTDLQLSVVTRVEFFHTVRTLIWAFAVIGCLYVGLALPVRYSAGQETSVTFVARALLDMNVYVWLPYLVAGGSVILWRRERELRKRTVRREHERVEEFEKEKDPNRTSSGFEE